jgi:hypothetical protein
MPSVLFWKSEISRYWMFVISFDVGRSMFDVGRSSFKPSSFGLNATRESLQFNLRSIGIPPLCKGGWGDFQN